MRVACTCAGGTESTGYRHEDFCDRLNRRLCDDDRDAYLEDIDRES